MSKEKETICTMSKKAYCECRETYSGVRECKLSQKAPYAKCDYQIIAVNPEPEIEEQPAIAQQPQPAIE